MLPSKTVSYGRILSLSRLPTIVWGIIRADNQCRRGAQSGTNEKAILELSGRVFDRVVIAPLEKRSVQSGYSLPDDPLRNNLRLSGPQLEQQKNLQGGSRLEYAAITFPNAVNRSPSCSSVSSAAHSIR